MILILSSYCDKVTTFANVLSGERQKQNVVQEVAWSLHGVEQIKLNKKIHDALGQPRIICCDCHASHIQNL